MSNTDSDVLLHIGSQQYYVLLAGRWYAGAKLEGPWGYVPGDKLPPDFAKIPEDSEMGTVLYAVPGTDDSTFCRCQQAYQGRHGEEQTA